MIDWLKDFAARVCLMVLIGGGMMFVPLLAEQAPRHVSDVMPVSHARNMSLEKE